MSGMKQDMARLQELVGDTFTKTGSLVAAADGGMISPEKLQKTLEQTADQFERATLELRRLCEQTSPGVGGYAKRPTMKTLRIAGSVETFGLGSAWLHITLNTLLPHCRFQTPAYLTDTIRRLLDDQYTLSVALLSKRSVEGVCHISLLDLRDASDFFAGHSGYYAANNIYEGRWP